MREKRLSQRSPIETNATVATLTPDFVLLSNSGSRGLRVRLLGPPGNPMAIGAQVRMANGTHFGPAREIHGGAGYLSQSSSELVFHGAEKGASLWVQWSGGRVTNEPILENTLIMTVRFR